MNQIGRKIYYEIVTGNVIVDTGERQGDVVETTEDQDFTLYAALQPYQRSAVGVLQLNFGDNAQNFGTYPYHIDITKNPPVISWDTANPIGATLADVQKEKIGQLRVMYNQTLASGFNVTIGTTQYTFGWTTDDKTNLLATQEGITDGDLSFPIHYADVSGAPVNIPDQTTLSSIKSTATRFFNNQHQKILTLVAQVQAATTTSEVNAIQWTPATY